MVPEEQASIGLGAASPRAQAGVRVAALRETLLASLLLALLLGIFFWKPLLRGEILATSDGLFRTPFFAHAAPPGFSNPDNQILYDHTYQFIPWRLLSWTAMREGQLPLWNPYSFAGSPLGSTKLAASFFPVNLLLLLAPFEQSLLLSAFIRLWIAGISTYLLARYLRLGPAPSLLSAIAFMLCGFLVTWLGHPQVNVAIWLPALFLSAELLVRARTPRARALAMALAALVIGIQYTGGHIETTADMFLALGLYYLLRWRQERWSDPAGRWRALLLYPLGALLLGTGLGAIQLAPFLEWLFLSAEFQTRSGYSYRLVDQHFWRYLTTLPLALYPNLYGNPTWDIPYRPFLSLGNYNEYILYIGTLPFGLSLVGALRQRGSPVARALTIVTLVMLAMAVRLPLFDLANQLPLLSMAATSRLRLCVAFTLCLLAGFGAQALWERACPDQRAVERLWLRVCAGMLGLGLLIWLAGRYLLPALREALERNHFQPGSFYSSEPVVYLPALLALLALALAAWNLRARPLPAPLYRGLLIALVAFDLLAFGHDYNPSSARERFYPASPVLEVLRQDRSLFRVAALNQDLIPDAQMMFGLSDVRGGDFPLHLYKQYLSLNPDRSSFPWYNANLTSVNSALIRVLNLKYVFSSSEQAITSSPHLKLAGHYGPLFLGEVKRPQPRSFMLYQAVVARDDAEALALLGADPEQVFQRVVLQHEGAPPPQLDLAAAGAPGQVELLGYALEETSWRVSSDRPGYLVNSDSYYPGWNAYIDGQPAALYRANLAFRAVHVPAGQHVVSFRYEPLSFRIGLWLTALSAVALLGLLLYARRAGAREHEASST